LLEINFTDTFRYLYPDKENAYTWWSYMGRAREKNIGWRMDYFITSNSLKKRIIDSKIHFDIMGSDHCPIELDIEI
jgi:exodeoxyribonuclease-3